ncbi:MAG: hypothetical protein RLY45_1752 [Actinomycetota bacterium]
MRCIAWRSGGSVVRDRLRHLPVAVAFLTRIPVRHGAITSWGHVAAWFAVAGLIPGSISAAVYAGLLQLLAPLPSAVLAVGAGVAVTGAFHHDGLADSMDGLVGGWTREQRLEILKDSRHGTYGVMVLVVQVAAQVSLVSSMDAGDAAVALIAAHVLGRAASVVLTQVGESASDGLGGHYVRDVTGTDAALAVVSGTLLCAPLLGGWLAVVLPAAVATALLFGWWAMRKIGGLVGDVLGGAEQVAETAVLACCAAIAGAGAIAWWM